MDKITLNDIYNMGNWLAGTIEMVKDEIFLLEPADGTPVYE